MLCAADGSCRKRVEMKLYIKAFNSQGEYISTHTKSRVIYHATALYSFVLLIKSLIDLNQKFCKLKTVFDLKSYKIISSNFPKLNKT